MNLTHDFTVPASLDEAWAAFNHLELITSCFPGATLTSVDGQDFAGTVKVKLGQVPLSYTGTGKFLERHLGGRHTVIQATGSDRRGKGSATVKVTMSFQPSGEATAVHVVTDVSFTGQPAQFAPAVVEDAGARLVAQFAESVSSAFSAGLGAEALEADANPSSSHPLGTAASSSSKTYTYNPPSPASQTDYDVFVKVAPLWAKKVAPPVLGGLALWWLVRRIRRR
jgi:carbon monoxide dehydrogenase subunit G